jgi:hypothetical protein
MKEGKIIEKGIRRVVWVPEKLDHEIENLRHNIGYTRSGFYRYALTRLIEQLLLTKQKELHLQPWQEIVGTLKEIKTNEETTTAIVMCTQNTDHVIIYPNQTKEAEVLQTLKNLQGQKVAILRTDLPDKPILIRSLEEPATTSNSFWRSLLVRSSLILVAFKQLIAFNIALWHLGWHLKLRCF